MKKIVVLGSTGSIGQQTLDVVRHMPKEFCVIALCAGSDAALLRAQAQEFHPAYLGLCDSGNAGMLKDMGCEVVAGENAAAELSALPEADIIVNGVSGFAGMAPLICALRAGKTVALANKESIVCGDGLIKDVLRRQGGRIIPVDSEQSALYQCLFGGARGEVKRLMLTASGGPFRTYSRERMQSVTPAEALRHPTWKMGKKITVDCATLFNKGLEVMEAAYLFDMPFDKISVVIHPESIVHSMVEFVDNAILAQLSAPDMRLAIQYALTETSRMPGGFGTLDLAKLGALHFEPPDEGRFPALRLAYAALREGGALPIAYNGANEVAVRLFLQERLGFMDIAACVEHAMGHIHHAAPKEIDEIFDIDAQARRLASAFAERNPG
ncbi:MAG: 1-deoxy-D-xylulose-5-phosphate reductoisomerase [Christensenellaceae bacterium]|jgi:1-deoxy-D-xylulose-5-phosphate reductoisomerase|nr:1-deoxy-D-xylulose-5-phosphate reductoisomerase [Christensenellaceae bacterium]